MNIAEVLPLQRLPRSQNTFDYTAPDDLKLEIGSLVKVPFRAQQIAGLVLGIKKTTSVNKKSLKAIIKLINNDPALKGHQVRLLNQLAQYYLVSPAMFVRLFVPEPLVRRANKSYPTKWSGPKAAKTRLPKKLNSFLATAAKERYILHHQSNYLALITQMIAQQKTATGQQLIILPDLARLNYFLSSLPLSWQKQTAVFHGQLSKGALNEAYGKIRQGKIRYIIGLKRTLFVPFNNLKKIWLVDEDDPSHKQYDQNPRFHVRTVSQMLAQEHRAQLTLTSQSPSLSGWSKYNKTKVKYINIGKPQTINVITLAGAQGNDRVISPALLDHINHTTGKVFLLINQKGQASGIICQDCQRSLRCDRCDHILSGDNDNQLTCKNCFAVSVWPVACPNCQGHQLRGTGLTIQRVVKAVTELLPDKTVGTLSQGEAYPQRADIIVGTQNIISYPSAYFSLSAMISIDQQLARPSYDAEFRTWQILRRLSTISDYVLVQAHEATHPFIRLIQKDTWRELYQYLWRQREQWHYPPSWFGVKLLLRHKSQTTGLAEANKLKQLLAGSNVGQLEILGPFMLHPFHRAGKYGHGLMIRWPKRPGKNTVNRFQSLVPDEWQIDVEPIDLQ